jgi:hypothetical protein
MAAIITDQIRILNARNFLAGVTTSGSSYYSFIGLPNATDLQSDWDNSPPAPIDNFDNENEIWETVIGLKKITNSDIKLVVPKINWKSGNTYDMYRHDYSTSNTAKVSGATNLYNSFYFVMNSDYRVYICLQNGTTPETPNGVPSLDEPTFVDLEPRAAGASGDGYIWKYLYTISPSDIVKFDSTNYIPVPSDWTDSDTNSSVRDNAVDGSIKIVTIENRGVGLGTANAVYTNVPIKGNGTGATCTITMNADSQVESVIVSNQGSGYTYGNVDLIAGGVPTGSTMPVLGVISTPQGGHGADIFRELGTKNILLYSRFENDIQNPDFITGNQIARIGIVEKPNTFGTNTPLSVDKASAVMALRLTGAGYSSATYDSDSFITQTVSTGTTAVARVVSYDQATGVLKVWQDRAQSGFNTVGVAITNPQYGFDQADFTASPTGTGSLTINGGSVTEGLTIDSTFTGISTVINNRTFYLGQSFTNGIANPEVAKYSGNIIYVDNRPSVTRSTNQKEDIKVILQF